MAIYDQLCCIFIHIPKTGGQSIHSLLGGSPDWYQGVHQGIEVGHATARMVRDYTPDRFATYFRFAIVRHPLDRLVSEYYFSKLHCTYTDLLPSLYVDFATYVRCISELDFSALEHYRIGHLLCQSDFVFDGEELLVDYVGRFENFQRDVTLILSKIGLSVENIPHLNRTEHSQYMSYYDHETEKIARRIYASDFRHFQYD